MKTFFKLKHLAERATTSNHSAPFTPAENVCHFVGKKSLTIQKHPVVQCRPASAVMLCLLNVAGLTTSANTSVRLRIASKWNDDVLTAVYFHIWVTAISKNSSFLSHYSLHKVFNKSQIMSHAILFLFCHLVPTGAGVTDRYHGNMTLSAALA